MMAKIWQRCVIHSKTVALILGSITAFIFPPFFQLEFLPLAFGGAFALTDAAKNYRRAAAVGYWFGFGLFATGLYWVGNALLVDVEAFGWLYLPTLFGAGAFFGLFTILPFIIWRFFRENLFWQIVGFAAVWTLLEWLRSFILTGFPWNMVGTAWSFDATFIQSAAVWGTYGLTFISLAVSGCAYAWFKTKKWRYGIVFILIPICLWGGGYYRLKNQGLQESDVTVRLVQPSIEQRLKWDEDSLENNFKTYIALSRQKTLADVDFVIWGETATPFDLAAADPYYRQMITAAVPSGGYLITGALRSGDNYRLYNSMFVLDENGQIFDFYDKSHLVPFGEYVPLRKYLPDWVRPVVNQMAEFEEGQKLKTLKIGNYPMFGALICYEIIFPDAVVDRQMKPDWLVVLTNDGWYGDSAGPYQHLAAAQMRAVEEGITVVRSANSGISAVIDPLGRIVARLPYNEVGIADVKLPHPSQISTCYNGSVVIWVLFLIVFVGLGLKWKKQI